MTVARRSPDLSILTAVITLLRNSSGLSALATGGIYTHVPQGTAFPYVEVTAPTAHRVDTFARAGAETTLDVKAVSQGDSEQTGLQMRDYAILALNGQTPALTGGHATLGIRWENNERFEEIVNAIRTKHHVASFTVWTEQTTS